METCHSWASPARAFAPRISRFESRVPRFGWLIIAVATILTGCGAPGDPVPPSPPVAIPIADLSAHQMGDGVALNFSLPNKTIRGDRLQQPPAIEILRGELKPDGSPNLKSFHVVETIARFATSVNEQTENIGARRLHTILDKVLDELSFEASDLKKKNVKVDAAYVNKQLADIVKNQDLSRYIL